jgi:hypothetical protein
MMEFGVVLPEGEFTQYTLKTFGVMVAYHPAPSYSMDLSGLPDDEVETILRDLGFTEENEPWLARRAEERK